MNEPIHRPSLREAARRGAEAKRQAQPTQPAAPTASGPTPAVPPPAAKAPPPPQRPKPPVVGVEQVVVLCGHAVPFELFDPKYDKYRSDRRKKLTDRDCTACRVKAQEAKEAAEREAAKRRRQERAKQAPPANTRRDRLPDGARFDVAYDATAGMWSGTLAVAGLAPFTASASAVFQLLRVLDDLYRKAAAAAVENRDVGK